MSEPIEKRIFVGNIYQNLHECCEDLYVRFGKIGKVTSKQFEEHDHFAYINMEFTTMHDFQKLKNQFNNVKFKGNTLKVDLAKEDFYARWVRENTGDDLEGRIKKNKILKHEWEHYKKVQNIKKTWLDRRQVIYGRHRTIPRSAKGLRKVTFRIFNERGELKVYKCYKNKLWGYDKKKTIRDLVFEFSNNKYWKDGNHHIVERLDYSRSKVFFKNGDVLRISSKMQKDADTNGHQESNHQDHESEEEGGASLEKEHNVNSAVLNNLLGNFNFDKPMTLNNGIEENEEYGSSDYEFSNKYLDQSSEDEKENEETTNAYESKVESENYSSYSQPTEEQNQEEQEEQVEKRDDDDESEEEFMPTFGAAPAQGTISNTETLRGLFADKSAPSFKLIQDDDDDIDHEKDVEMTKQEEENEPVASIEEAYNFDTTSRTKNENGLFFPHFDSYFLNGQTQLAKLKPKEMETFVDWDKQFWDNRAEWTKELKQKKRDAIRKWKKKNNQSNILL